jgi:hypothetical protein
MPVHNNGGLDSPAERAVVVRLLEDYEQPVTRDELYSTRADIGAERLDAAIISLTEAQVVRADGGSVRTAPALRRLDDLRLIAI